MMTSPDDFSAPRDAREAFAGLVRWIVQSQASAEEPQLTATKSSMVPLVDLADASSSASRGLSAAADIPAGGVLCRLPWSCAITPTSVLRSSSLKRLLPGRRLLALRDLLRSPNDPLLPHPWSLLLALGLLCELADPRATPRKLYASLLPAPPGTPVAAAAPFGPSATDILLFNSRELEALCCEPLARASKRERKRLAALHGVLFGGGSGDDDDADENRDERPSVSLVSFLWAHSLVRSRALDLRVVGGGGGGGDGETGGEVCLLPLIDLAQHDDRKGRGGGGESTSVSLATLRFVSSSSSSSSSSPNYSPVAVELVAGASRIPKGSHICLNYGSRPLRDLVRGYAFVPKTKEPSTEIFEDFSGESFANKAALVVDASGLCSENSLLRLSSVRLLAEPGGDDQALEFGRARVVFVVVAGEGQSNNSSGSSSSSNSVSPVVFTASEEDIPIQPTAEVGICRWVSRECEELASEIESWGKGEEQERRRRRGEKRGKEEKEGSTPSWLSKAAEELASDYRTARITLLRRCSESLQAQAWLVESASSASASASGAVNY